MVRRTAAPHTQRNETAGTATRDIRGLHTEAIAGEHVEALTRLMYATAIRNPRSLFFFEPHGDFGFWHFAESRATEPVTAGQQNRLRDFLRSRVQMQARGESLTHVAKHAGQAVGFVSIDAMTPREAAVSYFFAERTNDVRPRGSATAAVRGAVLDAFRRRPALECIYGLVASNNIRSVKILRRLRFEPVDQLTAHHWAQHNIDAADELWRRGLSSNGDRLIPQPGKTMAMILTRERSLAA